MIGRIALASALVLGVLLLTGKADDAPQRRRSGFDDMSRDTQMVQTDDAANPGMLWVSEGEALWSAKTGSMNKACADCHGGAAVSMKGVATRYPAWDEDGNHAIDLEQRIQQCSSARQQAAPLSWDARELLALTAYVAHQSRGMPIAPPTDLRLEPVRAQGRAMFSRREGQLNLSCASCHDDNASQRLAGSVIPQGHPNGYPLYRLEWQSMGLLQRRLRNCMVGVRAEPFAFGSEEFVALESYLMVRAAGMKIETPGVRP